MDGVSSQILHGEGCSYILTNICFANTLACRYKSL